MSPDEFAEMFGNLGWGGNSSGSGGGFSDFFSTLFGRGNIRQGGTSRGNRTSYTHTQPQAVRNRELEVNITLEEAYHGTTRIIDTGDKRIQAKIPKGVRTGSKVRLAGQGTASLGGGAKGDLYLIITIEPHLGYSREGDDLTTDGSLNFYKAIFGGEMKVKTLSGEITLKVPPQTQGNTKLRLKGKGMPHLENPQQYGDLYVKTRLTLPSDLTEKEISELKDLAERYNHF